MKPPRWPPLLFLVLAVASVAPVFRHPDHFAWPYDWRYFQSWLEVGRRTLLWYHQLPVWNPYGCGGEVLWANPQSMVASPIILLMVLFGTALGIKVALVAYAFCAFDGAYRLTRSFGVGIGGALVAAVVFGTNGWLALHVSSGHANFASASLFPYLWLFYRHSVTDEPGAWRWTLPLGAVAAWIVADGGTTTPAMATVLLATVATIDAVQKRSARPYLLLLGAAGVAALIGCARLLPTLEFAIDHPRHQWETDANTVWSMIANGYIWRGVEAVSGKHYWFHEYGWRLAYVTPPLILVSLFVRRTRAVWLVVVVGATIVAGRAIPYGPWWLLKHLPLFRDLRVPSRYSLLFALGFSILCGAAWCAIVERLAARGWSAKKRTFATALLVVVCAIDGVAFDWFCYHDVFQTPMAQAATGTRFFQAHSEWRTMMNHVLDNHGAIGCDEEAPLERADHLDEGDVAQVRLADPAAGTVRQTSWSPNRISFSVRLTSPTTVLINQNWNEHWRTTQGKIEKVGGKVERDVDGGRLGVALPAGEHEFSVYYRPRSFTIGLIVSAISAPMLLALWLVIARRRRRA